MLSLAEKLAGDALELFDQSSNVANTQSRARSRSPRAAYGLLFGCVVIPHTFQCVTKVNPEASVTKVSPEAHSSVCDEGKS